MPDGTQQPKNAEVRDSFHPAFVGVPPKQAVTAIPAGATFATSAKGASANAAYDLSEHHFHNKNKDWFFAGSKNTQKRPDMELLNTVRNTRGRTTPVKGS